MCSTTETALTELIEFGNLLAIKGPGLRSIKQNCEDVQLDAVLVPHSLGESTEGNTFVGTDVLPM